MKVRFCSFQNYCCPPPQPPQEEGGDLTCSSENPSGLQRGSAACGGKAGFSLFTNSESDF